MHYQKTCVFSAQRAHWTFVDFQKITFILGDKKTLLQLSFIFIFFHYLFQKLAQFFYFVALTLTFLEIIFVALINFFANRPKVDFEYFLPPALIRFWIYFHI